MSVDRSNPLIFWPTAFGILLIWTYISKWYEAWKERRSLRQMEEENKRGWVWSDEKMAFVPASKKNATDVSDDPNLPPARPTS
jgi:hypothetical protein